MQSNERDAGYLWDMLQAATRIQRFTENLSFDAYQESDLVQSAVERQFEILGEAARRISEEFKQSHAEIPWSGIIGQRNVIAHQYDDIQQTQLWSVVKGNIPTLITQIEGLIPSPPSDLEV
jgi:uncharacterized protein with HEPN domain